MGRPALPASQRKGPSFAFRMKPELRGIVEAGAAVSGRSLAQEIEYRLDLAYGGTEDRLQNLGSEDRAKLLRALGLTVDLAETLTGKDAFTDPETADIAYKAMTGLLDALFAARPGGPSDPTTPTEGQEAVIRDSTARTLDQNIRDAILETVLPQLPGAAATFAKKGKG